MMVSWPCLWCREPFSFGVKPAATLALDTREATCPSCGARIGLELEHSSVGWKLHYKRVRHGRAGKLEVSDVDDQLVPSLCERPLATGDRIELRRDGTWHAGRFAWDGSGDGRATLELDGGSVELDPAAAIVRWPAA